jgi:hypothetical protein
MPPVARWAQAPRARRRCPSAFTDGLVQALAGNGGQCATASLASVASAAFPNLQVTESKESRKVLIPLSPPTPRCASVFAERGAFSHAASRVRSPRAWTNPILSAKRVPLLSITNGSGRPCWMEWRSASHEANLTVRGAHQANGGRGALHVEGHSQPGARGTMLSLPNWAKVVSLQPNITAR